MNGQSNSLSIAALMSGSSNTTMKKSDSQESNSYATLSSNKEMEVLESLLQLQMSKDDKPSSSLNATTKRKSFQANEEQQLILQSIPPITHVEPISSIPSSEPSKIEHIEDSLPRDKRLRQFQNTFFDSGSTSRFNAFSSTQPNPNGTSPVWPNANLSLPLPPKSRPLANYNSAHSKSLNDLQSMVRITKNLQRPPPPSALIPKKCNSFEELPGVVKTEKPFSNIQLPVEFPPSPESEPKNASNSKNATKKPALPFEPTFLVRDKIPPNRRFFDEQWMQHFQELKEFHAKYGHTNVTRTADEYRGLGNWVAEQRRKLRKGRLSKEQFDLLNTIDFEWDRSYYFKATTENGMSPSPPASPPVSRHASPAPMETPQSPQTPVFAPVESLYPKPLPPLPFQMTEIKKEQIKPLHFEKILNVTDEAPSSPMDCSYTFSPSYPIITEPTENKIATQNKTLSILIAQEDVSNRIILVKLLEGMGYEDIDVAEGGFQMMEMARNKQYDCIVLDLAISGVDAIEFTRHLRSQQNKHQPYMIGVSTKSSSVFLEDRNRCIQAGLNEIVSSPLNRDHLSAALQTCYAFKYD